MGKKKKASKRKSGQDPTSGQRLWLDVAGEMEKSWPGYREDERLERERKEKTAALFIVFETQSLI